jgi:hypothetical protein
LGKDPSNTEDINKIFRAFHSLKGNARMLGFDRLCPFGKPAYHEGKIVGKVLWGSRYWMWLNKGER